MSKPVKFIIETLWQTVVILVIALSGEVELSVNAATTAIKSTSIIESKIDTVQEHLAAVNSKLDVINGAILSERQSCLRLMPNIEEKFRLIEHRLEQLNHKYDELINQNTDNIEATQKSVLNIDVVPAQRSDNGQNDDFRNRFSSFTSTTESTTKSETTKIENNLQQLLRPTRNLTSSYQNNTNNKLASSVGEEATKNRQRQNRESKRNVNFINELLKMVNDRLSPEDAISSSSMTDISNVENSNTNSSESTTIVPQPIRRRNKTSTNSSSHSSRKSSGIVFPNIKNRLAMMNATSNFISSIKLETYVCGNDKNQKSNEEIHFVTEER